MDKTDWAYFVVAWLHADAAQALPFAISAAVTRSARTYRVYASEPMTRLDARLMRWRMASVQQCAIATDVVYGPVDDPFQTGRGT